MAASTTSQVYIQVIEDVMNKVRDEFINNSGPGKEVLKELQATWETKMIQAGVIFGPIDRSAAAKPMDHVYSREVMRGDDLLDEEGLANSKFPKHWKGKNGLYCVGLAQRGFFGAGRDVENIADEIASLLQLTESLGYVVFSLLESTWAFLTKKRSHLGIDQK